MTTAAYLNGQRLKLDPQKIIGKGGEADIFQFGADQVVKLFKPPSHPDLAGQPAAQAAARKRLALHQTKLAAFPKGLPERVITPQGLVTNQDGSRVVGYVMKLVTPAEVLLRYSDKGWRQTGVDSQSVVNIFRDLHSTVAGVHRAGVVIGDFNDLNVMVKGTAAYLIDADSWQFGRFLCSVFTPRFTDPLLLDNGLNLSRPFNRDSDWYAYAVMLMQSLVYVDPYGGLYRPKDSSKRLVAARRPLSRITVFNPEVRYPKPALPYGWLPDELLERFVHIFDKDERGKFPLSLVENVRWTTCRNCGTEHARPVCPVCTVAPAAAIKATVTIRGTVTATRIFRTSGTIVAAIMAGGKLRWLYHQSQQFKREDDSVVAAGALDPQMRFRLGGACTILAKTDRTVVLAPNQHPEVLTADSFGRLPQIDANQQHYYWLAGGQLMRSGLWGPEQIATVLSGQTLFWVGPTFGFGLYRAHELQQAFTFDATERGINDNVPFPRINGQLVDATAVFTSERCWFLWSTQDSGQLTNHAVVIRRSGQIEASAQASAGDGSWLGTIRGKCAVGQFLLAATDAGIVRVETNGGGISQTRSFPDTEPFVDASVQLFAGADGLYVVTRKDITRLEIK